METTDFEKIANEIEGEIGNFERTLRTSFSKHNPNNHLVIQRVHIECQNLKTKVDELLKNVNIQKRPKAIALWDRARFYTNKFEEAIMRSITLDGDILRELGKQKK